MTIVAWAKAYAQIAAGDSAACPKCGHEDVQSRFVGDPATRLGYGLLWCTNCGYGARLSRVKVPENLEIREWEDENALAGVPEINFEEDNSDR